MGNAAAAKKIMMLGVRENPRFDFKQPTIVQLQGVIRGWCASTRPQMCNCTSGNLEIPGSMLRIAPE